MTFLISDLVESWKGGVGRWIPCERGHAGVQAGVQSGLQVARLTANRNRVSAQLSVLCTTCTNLQTVQSIESNVVPSVWNGNAWTVQGRNLQCLESGSGFNQVSGSGSRRTKMTLKNIKKWRNFMFWSVNVLFLGLKAFLVAWTSFMEA
jgi:hypothetical protein